MDQYATPVARLIENQVMFLLKIMLISDKPLLSSQHSLSGHLPVSRGLPLNVGSSVFENQYNGFVQTVRDTVECIPYSVSFEYDNEPVAQKAVSVFEVFTMVNLSFFPSILTHRCFSSHSLVICYKAIKSW